MYITSAGSVYTGGGPQHYLPLYIGAGRISMNDITTLISNVGFPIAAFLLMWYQSNTTIKECTKAITELTQHIAHIDEKGDL